MSSKRLFILRVLSDIFICVIVIGICCAYYFAPSLTVTVSDNKSEPIYFGNRKSDKIALMFNCYEGADEIKAIAEILDENGFKATFFFGGCFADDNEKLLKFLADNGHEIANHGYFHKQQSKLDLNGNSDEIAKTEAIILAFCGVKTNLFAPPSGDFSQKTLQAAENLGYKVIMWSKDTIDWRDKDEKIVFKRATSNISGGDFVLMHPKKWTVAALPDILEYYIVRGFRVTTVSECME